MSTASDLNVYFDAHLVEALQPLVPILPQELSEQLSSALDSVVPIAPLDPPHTSAASPSIDAARPVPLIQYSLLSAISAWARSIDGRRVLIQCHLEPNAYMMVSLLAGTKVSPEKQFPATPRHTGGVEEAQREMNDRRAVTAVLNALLSVLGSGVATWWAADRLRWKNEWVRPPSTFLPSSYALLLHYVMYCVTGM